MRKVLSNEMESKAINITELSKVTGLSKGTLSGFFNNTGKELKFDSYLKIVRAVKHDSLFDLVTQYVQEASKPSNLAMCLEFASTNRYFSLTELILDKASNTKNKELHEYANIYSIIYKWQQDPSVESDNTLSQLRQIKSNNDNILTLIQLMEGYVYYNIKKYQITCTFTERAEDMLENMTNVFLKQSFKARISEMKAFIELRLNNNSEQSRNHCDELISASIGTSYDAFAYYTKGMSYFNQDVDNARANLEQSITIYKRNGQLNNVGSVKRKINLLENKWGVSRTNDQVYDQIFNHINNNDIEALNAIYSNKNNPEFLYFKGLLQQDNDTLLLSLIEYIKQGDSLMAELPQKELLQNGYSETVLDSFVQIKAC